MLLAGPTAGRAQTTSSRLTIAMPTHPERLEPVFANNLPKLRTLPNMFDGLLAFDLYDGMKIRPALARRWQRIDARTLEFELRPGVVFHDGSPLAADDVVFSLAPVRGRGPGGAGSTVTSQYLSTLEQVRAVAPDRIQVVTREPDPLIVDHDDPPCLVLHDNAVLYGMRADLAWRPATSAIMDFRSKRA